MKNFLPLFVILAFLFAGVASAQTSAPPSTQSSTLGGKTVTSAMGDTDQMMLTGAFGSLPGDVPSQLSTFDSIYNKKGGFPVLSWLGLNTSSFTSNQAFQSLFWGFLYVALGISMGRGVIICLGKGNPIPELAKVFYKIIIGFGLISLRGTIYSLIMTTALVMSNTVSIMQQNAIFPDAMRNANMGTMQFEAARKSAIDNAVSLHAGMLYPENVSLSDEIAIATAYNSLAAEANTIVAGQHAGVTLPLIDTSTQPNEDETQQIARLGRFVMLRAYPLVEDYAGFPSFATNIQVTTPAGTASISNLGNILQSGPEQTRAMALALPNTPGSQAQFQGYLDTYKTSVTDLTGSWIRTNLLQQGLLGHALTSAKEWLDGKVNSIASIAASPVAWMQKMVNALANGIGYVCTLIVGFVFILGVRILIEVSLFLLIITLPIWFIPSWEKAFTGILKSLVSFTIMVPAFQMLMLFADTVMAALLRFIMLGPAGLMTATSVSSNAAGMGLSTVYVGSMVAFDPWGYIAMIVGYTIGYLAFTSYMAFKTPSIVSKGLQGAGLASAIVGSWATGLISAGLGAIAMGGAASGGMLGKVSQSLKGGNYTKSLARAGASRTGDTDSSKAAAPAAEPATTAPSADVSKGYSRRKKTFAAQSKKMLEAAQLKAASSAPDAAAADQSAPSETDAVADGKASKASPGRLVRAAMGLGRIARHTPRITANAFSHTREGAGTTLSNYMSGFKEQGAREKAAHEKAAAANEKGAGDNQENHDQAIVQRPSPVTHPRASSSPRNIPGKTQREVRPATQSTRTSAARQQATAAAYVGGTQGNRGATLPSRPSIPQNVKGKSSASTPKNVPAETQA